MDLARLLRDSLMVIAFCIATATCDAAAPATAPADPARWEMRSAGCSIVVPPGWRSIRPANPSAAAQFQLRDGKAGTVLAETMVIVSVAKGTDLDTYAAAAARETGGAVMSGEMKLDGVRALRFRTGPAIPVGGSAPAAGLIAIKGGIVYGLQAKVLDPARADANAIVDAFRAGWAWQAIVPVADDLAPRAQPFELLDGRVLVSPPASMRSYPVDGPARSMYLAAVDPLTGAKAFVADLNVIDVSADSDLETWRTKPERVAGGVAPTYTARPGHEGATTRREISSVIEPKIAGGAGRPGVPKLLTQQALLRIDDTNLLVISFTFNGAGPALAKYEEAAARMVDTIRVAPASGTAP